MTQHVNRSAWTLVIPSIANTFEVIAADVTLDDLFSIYCRATVTVKPVSLAVLAALDPTTFALRAELTVAQTIVLPAPSVPAPRTFKLFVQRRKVNDDNTVTLELGSDEAILELRGRVAATRKDYYDDTARTVRGTVNKVLTDFLGVVLQAGAVDAATPRMYRRTNLISNPDFETNTTGWVAGSNAGSIGRVADTAFPAFKLRYAAVAAGLAAMQSPVIACNPGDNLQANVWMDSVIARSCEAKIYFFDDTLGVGTILGIVGSGAAVTTPGFPIDYFVISGAAPAGTKSARIVSISNGNAAGNQHYILQATLEIFPPATLDELGNQYPNALGAANFDGGLNPDPTLFIAAWTGTAHATTSTLTPINAYPAFDAQLMRPGVTAASFLRPLVAYALGRLFCDEQRKWRLVDNTYTVAGTLTIATLDTISQIEDEIDVNSNVDGVPLTFTGVVILYTYTDRLTGATTTKYDVAGTNVGRVYPLNVDGPYPGPGAAAAILARAAGRKIVKPLTAESDYSVSPGMALDLTDSIAHYTGRISRVQWHWGDDGLTDTMAILPKELV